MVRAGPQDAAAAQREAFGQGEPMWPPVQQAVATPRPFLAQARWPPVHSSRHEFAGSLSLSLASRVTVVITIPCAFRSDLDKRQFVASVFSQCLIANVAQILPE